jgi:hypothetical protein
MKLIDGSSRIGRKLEKWVPHDDEEADKNKLKKHNQRRDQLPSADEPETNLETKIKKWFTAAEKDDRPHIIAERVGTRRKILVLTYHRAILFESGWLGRLKDTSDKVWRQFVSVHLTEKTVFSALDLRFFPHHDSVFYHNPYKDNSPYMGETDFKMKLWHLDRLNKEEARRIYAFLKDKELYWQEKRRKEQIAQLGPLNVKPPGIPQPKPQPKKKD